MPTGSYTKLVDLGENRAFYFYIVLDLDNNRAETVIGDTSYGVPSACHLR